MVGSCISNCVSSSQLTYSYHQNFSFAWYHCKSSCPYFQTRLGTVTLYMDSRKIFDKDFHNARFGKLVWMVGLGFSRWRSGAWLVNHFAIFIFISIYEVFSITFGGSKKCKFRWYLVRHYTIRHLVRFHQIKLHGQFLVPFGLLFRVKLIRPICPDVWRRLCVRWQA